jgi:hypothetical protein
MKLSDLDKIETGDFVSTSTGPIKLWWKVIEKEELGVWVQEKEGYSTAFVDACYITKHMKKDRI